MSFRVTYSDVIIANRALAMLPEAPISDFEQGGIAARALRLQYKPTIAALLEKHDFGLATKRSVMAPATNDRPEWTYKYEAPNDLAYAINVRPYLNAPGNVGYYVALRNLIASGYAKFMRVGRSIYSSIEGAELEYTSLDITEADFTEAFVEIVVPAVAAAICMDITKRDDLKQALEAEARNKLNNYLAVDRNQRGLTYGDTMTETELVRQTGISTGLNFYPTKWPI